MSKQPVDALAVHRVEPYPFVRETYKVYDEDGSRDESSWRPGVEMVPSPPYGEDGYAVADGKGAMVLTEVSRHKPGKYPERVFYTREFVDPDGYTFGKGTLRVCSAGKFTRLAARYAYPFQMRAPATTEQPHER